MINKRKEMPVQEFIRGMPVGVAQAIAGAFDPPNSQNLTATGTTQATALPLPRDFNVFTTVAASSGALLPFGMDQIASTQAVAPAGTVQQNNGIAQLGDTFTAVNRGTNALLVYPQLGGTVQGAAANTGFSVAVNKVADFRYVGSGNWVVNLSA